MGFNSAFKGLIEKGTTGARVTVADTPSYEGSRYDQLQHKGSVADTPSYGTNGGMPICPVTVLREARQYAQLRYKRRDADMPSYGTEGGLPI